MFQEEGAAERPGVGRRTACIHPRGTARRLPVQRGVEKGVQWVARGEGVEESLPVGTAPVLAAEVGVVAVEHQVTWVVVAVGVSVHEAVTVVVKVVVTVVVMVVAPVVAPEDIAAPVRTQLRQRRAVATRRLRTTRVGTEALLPMPTLLLHRPR